MLDDERFVCDSVIKYNVESLIWGPKGKGRWLILVMEDFNLGGYFPD